jgi:thiamine pyrophosphokinase
MDKFIKTCIFLNGTPPSKRLIKKTLSENDTIIATDGAYDYLKKYKFLPKILIGDMDSISELPQDENIDLIEIKDPESNDLEKALTYCLENNLKDIRIFGADGKRFDHALINIATLSSYSNLLNFEIITNEEYDFKGKRGQLFSLLAIHTADDLTLIGARYALINATLHKGSRGLSNAFFKNDLHVSFKTGSILYMTELKI